MRFPKLIALLCFAATFLLPVALTNAVEKQSSSSTVESEASTEAPTGFDNQTNGLFPQTQFEADKTLFDEREGISDGLGPVYNAQGCIECHQNPVSGGGSQIAEMRAGHFNGVDFTEHPGGSLIHARAIDASVQEQVLDGYEVRTFRMSLNTLGDGFVSAVNAAHPGDTVALWGTGLGPVSFDESRAATQADMNVPVEALNEMGITSPFLPTENTSNGASIAPYDSVADPEDDGTDLESFARYMRATKAPPRNETLAATADAQAGSQLFDQLGCAICHVRTITTAAAGTVINGGMLTVSAALGNKTIHPFSDFLLHNVGTGDGIVQNGGRTTRNKLRTPPLWGLRTRNQFMHDGQALSLNGAILRHAGEAQVAINSYRRLRDTQKTQLVTFLRSL